MSKATRDRAAARKAAAETPDKAPAKPVEPAAAPAPEPAASDIAPGLPGGPALPAAKPAQKPAATGALASASRLPAPVDPLRQTPVRDLVIATRVMVAWSQLEPDANPVRVLRLTRRDEIIDFMIADLLNEQLIDMLTRSRRAKKAPAQPAT